MKNTLLFSTVFLLGLLSLSGKGSKVGGVQEEIRDRNKLKALIIANGKYNTQQTGWSEITTENDIRLITAGLRTNGFYDSKVLVKKDLTRVEMVQAFEAILNSIKPGDVFFFHYSGHGQQIADDNKDEDDGFDECLVPIDAPINQTKNPAIPFGSLHFRDDEFLQIVNRIREKIGPAGQVVLSFDATHFGPNKAGMITDKSITTSLKPRGFFEEFAKFEGSSMAPYILLSACLEEGLNYATEDENGKDIGAYSYAFYKILTADSKGQKEIDTYNSFYNELTAQLKLIAPKQTPGAAGFLNQPLFFPGTEKKGNLFVLTIGIDTYNDFSLQYSKSDALRLGAWVKEQFRSANIASTAEPQVKILTDTSATFINIDRAFRELIKIMKPEDYFVFGYSAVSVQLEDGDINFYTYPSSIREVYRTKEEQNPRNQHFNLLQLKNWLNLIPAKNQLLISEAGDGKEFAKNLQKIVLGKDPIEAIMSDRNRIILSTNTLGFEGEEFGGGALTSFLFSIKENNLFYLFSPENRSKVEFEIISAEMNSDLHKKNKWGIRSILYSNFFYESQALDQLRIFKDALAPSKSRGAEAEVESPKTEQGILREAVQNFALIIGINDYDSPSWNDLTNPVTDAKAIEADLKNLYGFKTEMLTNPTKAEISQALFRYSRMKFDSIKSQLLIFWAGHGGYDEFVSGYLVARDSKSKEDDPLRDTYLEHSKLRNMLTNIKCPHVMLVLDACFGGTFDQRISKSGHRGEKDDPLYAEVVDDSFLKRKLKNNTRLYITSGGKTYVPDGRPGQHSPFARQFLELLRSNGGKDQILTFSEIKSGVERLTPEPCAGEFDGNEPGSDFMFISKK
ncbi:MAG: caspase family protein [Bacteroidetes bacterium]|nr:caspase family protein [Bacteroidota bacterium]